MSCVFLKPEKLRNADRRFLKSLLHSLQAKVVNSLSELSSVITYLYCGPFTIRDLDSTYETWCFE